MPFQFAGSKLKESKEKIMEQIYVISFNYYKKFYSYRHSSSELKSLKITVFVYCLLFVFSVVSFVPVVVFFDTSHKVFLSYVLLFVMFVFEVAFLFYHSRLKDKRDSFVSKKYQGSPRRIDLAKREWIKRECGKSANEYLDFAEMICKLFDAHKKSKRNESEYSRIFLSSIYNSDAKARITAYIIAVFSIIVFFLDKETAGLQSSFDALSNESLWMLLLYLLILLFYLHCIVMALVLFVRHLLPIYKSWNALRKGIKKNTDQFVHVLVADLIRLHRLPTRRTSSAIIESRELDKY